MLPKWLTTERDDPAPAGSWRPLIKRRAAVALVGVAVWAAVVEGRLVQVSVFQHKDLAERATKQQERVYKPTAPRGDIVDRNGRTLAYSVAAFAINADPSRIERPADTAAALCEALQDCTPADLRDLVEKLSAKARAFTPVRSARTLTLGQVERVAALKLRGVIVMPDTRRYYPNRDLAAHVLGFVGDEEVGRSGIERVYEEDVRGQKGVMLVQQDARLDWVRTRVTREPQPGGTLELTLDLVIQHIVERELAEGVERSGARAGTAIVMNPNTGEVLALANYPTFNPNSYNQFSEEARRNRAIQEVYEPGSTFKIVTASAAIEEGLIAPSDLIDCSPGHIKIGSRKPIVDTHRYGLLTFEDVIVKSSNVGAVKAGLRLGADRLSRYVRRFGFGEAIAARDFPGESAGRVYADLDDSAIASMSIGYQVSVTPMQMAAAASAVANGGILFQPHVVRAVVRDGRREEEAPRKLRRAIAPDTAATLTAIMEAVVERGTAKAAAPDRYRAAGKTGTTKKIIDGQYSNVYNASFVGFAPSRRPAITVLVVIDSPRRGGYYGGEAAAPVFKRITDATLQYLGVPPTVNPMAPVIAAAADDAPVIPARVDTQVADIRLFENPSGVPDVTGLGMRDAVRMLTRAGLAVRPTGDGIVVRQTPAAGTPLADVDQVTVELRRSIEKSTRSGEQSSRAGETPSGARR
jgi:cell division protein FtsI (penicillin-binding protein 3)